MRSTFRLLEKLLRIELTTDILTSSTLSGLILNEFASMFFIVSKTQFLRSERLIGSKGKPNFSPKLSNFDTLGEICLELRLINHLLVSILI